MPKVTKFLNPKLGTRPKGGSPQDKFINALILKSIPD
jgi:hypothetical protein